MAELRFELRKFVHVALTLTCICLLNICNCFGFYPVTPVPEAGSLGLVQVFPSFHIQSFFLSPQTHLLLFPPPILLYSAGPLHVLATRDHEEQKLRDCRTILPGLGKGLDREQRLRGVEAVEGVLSGD